MHTLTHSHTHIHDNKIINLNIIGIKNIGFVLQRNFTIKIIKKILFLLFLFKILTLGHHLFNLNYCYVVRALDNNCLLKEHTIIRYSLSIFKNINLSFDLLVVLIDRMLIPINIKLI